jgi:type IV pilus assembly protein PilM
VGKTSTQTLFYKDRPLFGLDIGFNTIKAMQLDAEDDKKVDVVGYGVAKFDADAIQDGIITDYESLAKSAMELFTNNITGSITTRRVAATIPAAKAYSRVISLPAKLNHKELDEAVRLEATQYIPMPMEELYLDYAVTQKGAEENEVLVVGVPKKIIDSYMKFFELIGLEVAALETTISSASRVIARFEHSDEVPTILVDLGSLSVDLTVFDKNLVVNGTIPGGGDDFSSRIADKLKIDKAEANSLKTKYGLGVSKHQDAIREALKPQLDSLIKEVRRVVRYYEERTEGKTTIGQIITMGGGANMPGLADYLTDNLRIPTRMCNFWGELELNKLQPPADTERSLYVTVAGVAITDPGEIWK